MATSEGGKHIEPVPSERNGSSVDSGNDIPRTLATRSSAQDRERVLERYIGTVLRQRRLEKGLTLTAVAAQAGLSQGMVSKIEHGQVATSLDSLARLTDVLGMTLGQVFRHYDAADNLAQLVKAGEGLEVLRQGTRSGHTYHLLAYHHGRQRTFEPFLIAIDDSNEAFPTFQHEGTQFLYVLKGALEYRHGRHIYRLAPGDSFTFDATVPHGPELLRDVPIRLLAVTVFEG